MNNDDYQCNQARVFSANSVASVVSLLLGWGQGPGCADLPNFLIPKHWKTMIYPAAEATCREHPLSEMAIMRLAPALGRMLKSMPGPSRRIR
jgi:hypothetical protein